MPDNKRGGRRAGAGRPPKSITERRQWRGKVLLRISPEAALKLQALMLQDTPDVHTPEQMVEYLIGAAQAAGGKQ